MNNKKSTKQKRMHLLIPEWLYSELEKKALELGINPSEAAREAIREFIKK